MRTGALLAAMAAIAIACGARSPAAAQQPVPKDAPRAVPKQPAPPGSAAPGPNPKRPGQVPPAVPKQPAPPSSAAPPGSEPPPLPPPTHPDVPPGAGPPAGPDAPMGSVEPIEPVPPSAPKGPISPRGPIAPKGPIAPSTGESPVEPAETGHAPRLLLPAEVTGDSEGEARARVGIGMLFGFGEATDPVGWDLGVVLGLDVTTRDGLARLVGAEREGAVADEPAGSFRLSASLARLDFEGEGGSAYPPLVLYAGGKVGRAPFSYLVRGEASRAQRNLPILDRREDVEIPWGVGATAIVLPGEGPSLLPTIEGQILFESRWAGSPESASWCVPVGAVANGDPSIPTTTVNDAESCEAAALGAPSRSDDVSLAAEVGIVDQAAGASWRAALGFGVAIPVNAGAPEDFRLTLRAPFYITLARAPAGTEYRGIIRITPSLVARRLAAGTTDVGAVLEVSLLGQRSLFPDQFDEL